MDFLKKHYEKVVLGLVLAGLIGGLVFMLFYINQDREEMDRKTSSVINHKTTPLPNLYLTTENNTLQRLQSPYVLNFETENKVFNPLDWLKSQDGSLIRAAKVGPSMCVVTNITPLYLIITLDGVTTNESGARYTLGVEKQGASSAAKRHKQQRFVSVGDKPNDVFSLVEVKGPAENPDSLLIKLVDSNETVPVSTATPYRRIDAYSADFKYDLERKIFPRRRAGDKVAFNGTDYVVSDINANEVILTDQTNQKKTSLPFTPNP